MRIKPTRKIAPWEGSLRSFSNTPASNSRIVITDKNNEEVETPLAQDSTLLSAFIPFLNSETTLVHITKEEVALKLETKQTDVSSTMFV